MIHDLALTVRQDDDGLVVVDIHDGAGPVASVSGHSLEAALFRGLPHMAAACESEPVCRGGHP